jgi:hypothetical protein
MYRTFQRPIPSRGSQPETPTICLAQFFTVQMNAEGRGADRFARPEEIDILVGTF